MSITTLFLFLSCFPGWLLWPPEAEPSAVVVEAGVAGGSQTAAPAPEEPPLVATGVVIEEIPKGLALEKAGLRLGDVILSWERLPNPPATPKSARGELASYFDWLELEEEQVPRGGVVLRGRRGRQSLELTVEPGSWYATVRPVLARALEDQYLAGKAKLDAGEIDAAAQTWRSLVACSGAEGEENLRAWVALRTGTAWEEKANWKKASEAYHEALEAAQGLQAQTAASFALGDMHESRNEYEAAAGVYASALESWQRIQPKSLMAANLINRLGFVAWAQGELDRAHDLVSKALVLQEQLAPQSLAVASSLNNLGVLARDRGELDRAQSLALRALSIQEQLEPQGRAVADSLNNLGMVAWARGELDQADYYYLQSLRVHERLSPQSIDATTNLNNLGAVAHARGDLDRAHFYYSQALLFQQRLARQNREVARSLNNLGALARDRGDLDRAQDYYRQALQIEEKIAPHGSDMGVFLNNMAGVARARGQNGLAYDYYMRSLRIQERVAPQSLHVASALSNLGNLAQTLGEWRRAEGYHLRALRICEKIADESLGKASNLDSLGLIARSRGDRARAQSFYFSALRIREKLAPQSRVVAVSLSHLGDLARESGDLERARDFYLRALDALENQASKLGGSYLIQAGFRAQHRDFYHNALELLFAQDRFTEAFDVLERFRAQTFLAMLAERDTVFTADIPEDLDRARRRVGVQYDRLLKRLAGLNQRDNGEEIEATRSELQKLDDEAGDIEASIRRASPRLAALQYPKPLAAAEARQTLDPGTLLLSYSVGKEKTVLFALSSSGDLEAKILPLGEEALRSKVKQLLNLIRESVQGSSLGELRQRRVQAASRELFVSLLGPVAEQIAASERLLILPDGPLHALPFAALVRDAGADTEPGHGQYLAEWKPLHVALSATVFAELKQRRRPASESDAAEAPIQLAAFGDPIYPQSLTKAKGDSAAPLSAAGAIAQIDDPHGDPIVRSVADRGIFDWPPLPYTRHEVEGIASLFPAGTSRTFLGPEALEDRIKSLDPKTRILHLAAHGYTDEHLPSSSFIALTIPADASSDAATPEHDNGLLQVWEIFERVRLDADLVVLSACDTALGEEQGGEGLIGLTRAFQYAGARTVMASLWSVRDQATSELMIRFYKHLRAGLPKDEALRQAQIELIRGPIEVLNEKGKKTLLDASAPHFWAGFQLYGDWQ